MNTNNFRKTAWADEAWPPYAYICSPRQTCTARRTQQRQRLFWAFAKLRWLGVEPQTVQLARQGEHNNVSVCFA